MLELNLFDVIKTLLLLMFLVIAAIRDFRTKKISLRFCLIVAVVGLALNIAEEIVCKQGVEKMLLQLLLGMAVGGIFILISKLTDEAIGYGDGLVMVVIGIYVGFINNLAILLYGFIISGIVGMILWLVKKKSKKSKMAFVPFLLAGYVISLI